MDESKDDFRINWQIKAPQVRVIVEEKQLGVMVLEKAIKIAQDCGMDLVEITANVTPPVCRVVNHGRFKYEQQIKKKENHKKQRDSKIQLKELRLRPSIEKHDVDVKTARAKRFLEEGMKVNLILIFKGQRELSHKEKGFDVVTKIIETLAPFSTLEKAPKLDGNRIFCCLSPKELRKT